MNDPLLKELVQVLRRVLPVEDGPVGLHEPHFAEIERGYVNECMDTGWVSSAGGFVERFEEQLCDYTGVKSAVAVVNGTAALHVSLQLAGVEPGDEVLLPALSFVATSNAVAYCRAVPHFVDCELKTLGVDPEKLRQYLHGMARIRGGVCVNISTGRRIRAAIAMHTFGHPVDLDPLAALCEEFGIVLVEDAAQSLGSFYKGRHTGNRGMLAALSFNGNKIITTGGGGAILTNDEELGRQAKHLTTTAKVNQGWSFYHDQLGYNYRMPNINAALGCGQLQRLQSFLDAKRELAGRYREALAHLAGITVFVEPDFARSNYWLNALLLDEAQAGKRDDLLALANSQGIQVRPCWTLLHNLPMYRDSPRMELGVAESLERRIINLPSSPGLGLGVSRDRT